MDFEGVKETFSYSIYQDQINTSVIVQMNGSSDYIEGYAQVDSTSGTPRVENQKASIQIFKICS